MVAKFTVRIDDKLVRAHLRKADKRLRNLKPVFGGPIRRSVAIAMQRQFDTRGAFFGTPWRPLSLTTVRMRSRSGGRSKPGRAKHGFDAILRDTDRLYRSMVRVTDPEGIREWGDGFLWWGTRVPYARYQQEGFRTRIFGRGPEVEVVARPMLPEGAWPPRVRRQWVVSIVKHLGPIIEGRGLF